MNSLDQLAGDRSSLAEYRELTTRRERRAQRLTLALVLALAGICLLALFACVDVSAPCVRYGPARGIYPDAPHDTIPIWACVERAK